LVEIIRAEWLAQLEWMIPLDLFEFRGLGHLLNVPNFCATRCSQWMIQIREDLCIRTLEIISSSVGQNHFHRPCYKPFLFDADKASWTLGTYNLEHFAIILIFHDFYTTRTICALRFVYKGIRYLRDNRVSEIWGDVHLKAKVQLCAHL
jgi:hypothetical protein